MHHVMSQIYYGLIDQSQIYYGLIDQFLIVRPCLEVGYECILMLHALHQGCAATLVLQDFNTVLRHEIISAYSLSTQYLKETLQVCVQEFRFLRSEMLQ